MFRGAVLRAPRMQMVPGERRRPRRILSTSSLKYKADYVVEPATAPELEPAAADLELADLPPLDWAGKPLDSIRRLFSDYAPRMNETEAFLWLLFVVALCGINFPLTKYVGDEFDGPTLLTSRFAIAASCFLPWMSSIKKETIPAGIETGSWLAAGYIAQAVCLTGGTNSGVASFFASMSCVLCPFFERAVGVKLPFRAWVAAAMGLAAAAVLELGPGILGGGSDISAAMPATSDFIGLLQPFFFGLYLFRTERTMMKYPSEAMQLTAIQVIVTGLVCGIWGAFGSTSGGLPELGDVVAQVSGMFDGLQDFDVSELQEKLPAILALVWMGVLPSGLALALETVIVHKLSSSVTVCIPFLWFYFYKRARFLSCIVP